jgi:hypothetical protein
MCRLLELMLAMVLKLLFSHNEIHNDARGIIQVVVLLVGVRSALFEKRECFLRIPDHEINILFPFIKSRISLRGGSNDHWPLIFGFATASSY